MFSVLPIGTNGLFPTKNNPTSGYLVSFDDVNVLVDLGSGVFLKLLDVLPPEKLDAIIITHYHFDHVSDIGVLSYYLQTLDKSVKVYAPSDGSPYETLIKQSHYLDFYPINVNSSLCFGKLRIDFYPMRHPIATYAVSFTGDGKKFSYTSDGNLGGEYEKLLLSADLAIIDSGFLKDNWADNKPLISAYHVGLLAKTYHVKRVLISHFNPKYERETILNEAKEEFSAVEPAEYKKYYL